MHTSIRKSMRTYICTHTYACTHMHTHGHLHTYTLTDWLCDVICVYFLFSDYNTISVIVVDAPDVTFSSLTSTENKQVNITCSADGRPGDMNFRSFKHYWNGMFIRDIPGTCVGSNESKLIFDPATYEDSGTYHCTVDNGVTDRSGTLLQKRISDLYIKGKYISMDPQYLRVPCRL